jgi:hypothetical protein
MHRSVRVLAKIGVAGYALWAGAAKHREAGDDVVAGAHVGDAVADRLDDRGRFVAQDAGRRMRVEPFHEMQVAVSPAKAVRSSTSRPVGFSSVTSSIVSASFGACKTAALMEATPSSAAMLIQPVQIPQRCVQSR